MPLSIGNSGLDLVVSGGMLYFRHAEVIYKVPTAGGAVQQFATTPHMLSDGLATDGTAMFWIVSTPGSVFTLMATPLAGGSDTPVYTSGTAGMLNRPRLSGAYVLLAESYTPGSLKRVTKAGTGVTTLTATAFPPVEQTFGYCADSNNAYFASTDGLGAVPVAGGSVTILNVGAVVYECASDGTFVYFVDRSANSPTIKRVPVGGGITTTLFTDDLSPGRVEVDDTSVYVNSTQYGAYGSCINAKIRRIPKAGGTATELAAFASSCSQGMTIDSGYVYTSIQGATSDIWRLPK